MNAAARIVFAVALLAGAVLFVISLRSPPSDPRPGPTDSDGESAHATPGPEAKPGVLDSHENCRACHETIYREWEASYHAQAWVDPMFKELSKDYRDESCHSCHAPRPVHEAGFATAEARRSVREAGITCLTCHQKGNRVVGPIRDPEGTPAYPPDCGPTYDPAHASGESQEVTNTYCGVCHNLHKTNDEFLGSRFAREGMTCLSCHMQEVVRPIVPNGKPRRSRIHTFPGAHSEELLRQAMEAQARVEGDRLVARTVNKGAGHKIPTDARHRAILLRVAFFDGDGGPVPVTSPLTGDVDREVTIDLIRLFYRWEEKESTQIDPEGTLGRDPWREASIGIPAAARGGKAVVRLYYLLRWDWPPERGVLVDQEEVRLE
ncbi:MAG: multiheme c-type cytochrome [Planctomycetaceae bacterium]